MKKVLFIGQFNILFQDISSFLTRFFIVQTGEPNILTESNLLSISKPDIILLDLLGMGEEKAAVFYELRTNCMDIPVLCLKSGDEEISSEMTVGIKKFKSLKLPAGNERITEVICELLGCRFDRANGTVNETVYTRKCVLAIDDNEIQLRMLSEMLKADYDVMLANSAMKALTMIGKRVPDAILLDYDMPMCDGRMAMQMIRELEEAKDVPVIFLTGVKDAAHIRAVLDLHPAGYLLKPAKRDMLRDEIRKAIR